MKPQILATLSLSLIYSGVSVGLATELPQVERLPAASSQAPIVTYRRVYLHESVAEIGSRLYDKVDYELKLRQLARDIRITEAELELQRERMQAYDEYFGYSDAGLLTLQNAKLDVLRSEEQLKVLRRAKLLALRHRNDQIRYRKLLLEGGAARLQLAQ